MSDQVVDIKDARYKRTTKELLAWMRKNPISQQDVDEFVARFGPFKRLDGRIRIPKPPGTTVV